MSTILAVVCVVLCFVIVHFLDLMDELRQERSKARLYRAMRINLAMKRGVL